MKIGINSMSTIRQMNEDFEETIQRLKDCGCDMIEPMSDWGASKKTLEFFEKLTGKSGWDPENAKKRIQYIRSHGMDVKGMFVFDECLEEQLPALGGFCRENQISYVVLSFMDYTGIDDIYEKMDMIRRIAPTLKSYGVTVCLHNHDHDSHKVTDRDGKEKAILDMFIHHLSPEEMMLETDTGWLIYAGIDPVKYVSEHQYRIAVLHFKDLCRDFGKKDRNDIFVACGQGVTDYKAILQALSSENKKRMLYVIDQDNSQTDIVADLCAGIQYFKGLETGYES